MLNKNPSLWCKLLGLARKYPVLTGSVIFVVLFLFILTLGYLFTAEEKKEDIVTVLDNAGIIVGLLSLTAGWPVALLAWARRKEAALVFHNPGEIVDNIEESFDASLILASIHCQPEWHLRHIRPKRTEFVMSSSTLEATKKLVQTYCSEEGMIRCTFFQDKDAVADEDAYKIQIIKDKCKYLLNDMLREFPQGKICIDITSGTSIMSIAAFQVAEELGITTIYLIGTHRNEKGQFIIDKNNIESAKAAKPILLADHRQSPTSVTACHEE